MKTFLFILSLLTFISVSSQKTLKNGIFEIKYKVPEERKDCEELKDCLIIGDPCDKVDAPKSDVYKFTNWFIDCPCYENSRIIYVDRHNDFWADTINEYGEVYKQQVNVVFKYYEKDCK